MDFKSKLKEKISNVEKILKEYMPKEDGHQINIFKSMNYSLNAGGKRLRPILMIEACKLVGGREEDVKGFAAAVEMIHTYSLIHDDLPALDNDDLRRGLPTNHIKFGEAMAILAGDGLLNYSYEIMTKESINSNKPLNYLKAMNEIATGSGVYGMIGGQVVDIESENKTIEKEKLDFIHLNKTAKLIISSMRAGAIIGDANEEQLNQITNYAYNIGLAFQIYDDILDIIGDESKLGKNVGSDIENNKSTYPSLLGFEESKKIAFDLIDDAKINISKVSDENEFLRDLADYIVCREY